MKIKADVAEGGQGWQEILPSHVKWLESELDIEIVGGESRVCWVIGCCWSFGEPFLNLLLARYPEPVEML